MSDYVSEPISEMKMIAAAPEVKLLAAKAEPRSVEHRPDDLSNPIGHPPYGAALIEALFEMNRKSLLHSLLGIPIMGNKVDRARNICLDDNMTDEHLEIPPFVSSKVPGVESKAVEYQHVGRICRMVPLPPNLDEVASSAKSSVSNFVLPDPWDPTASDDVPNDGVQHDRIQRLTLEYRAGIVTSAEYTKRLKELADQATEPKTETYPAEYPEVTAESLTDELIEDRREFAERRGHLLQCFREAIAQDRRDPLPLDPDFYSSRAEGLYFHLTGMPRDRAYRFGITGFRIIQREIVRRWSPFGDCFYWIVQACLDGRRRRIESDTANTRPQARRQLQAAVKRIKDEHKQVRAIFHGSHQ